MTEKAFALKENLTDENLNTSDLIDYYYYYKCVMLFLNFTHIIMTNRLNK